MKYDWPQANVWVSSAEPFRPAPNSLCDVMGANLFSPDSVSFWKKCSEAAAAISLKNLTLLKSTISGYVVDLTMFGVFFDLN